MQGEQRKRSKRASGGGKRRQQGGVGECQINRGGHIPCCAADKVQGGCTAALSLLHVPGQPYSLQRAFGSLGW